MLRDLLNDQAGNARRGQRYRTVQRGGHTVHDYAHGPDVAVGDQHAQQVGGMAHVPAQGPMPGPPPDQAPIQPEGAPQPMSHLPAGNLADFISGQQAYEQQGGPGGPVLGGHMHDAAGPNASIGHNAQGQQYSQIRVGGRDFHVYFAPDGTRMVREIKRPPTFTPTPA